MLKQKFYVVWKGRVPGIYDSWEACNAQISGFAGAEYKSFKTRTMAEDAFKNNSENYIGKDIFETELTPEQLVLLGVPKQDTISVDADWNTVSMINVILVAYRMWTVKGIKKGLRCIEEPFVRGDQESAIEPLAPFIALVNQIIKR